MFVIDHLRNLFRKLKLKKKSWNRGTNSNKVKPNVEVQGTKNRNAKEKNDLMKHI